MQALPPNAVQPSSRAAWRAWLLDNHERSDGVWLVTFKKGAGQARIEYADAVEEALCFGWIDSKPNKLDDLRSMLWFAPRKGKTGWSRPNKERVDRLTRQGLMHAAGLAKVQRAMEDGSWSSLDAIENLESPPDLVAALQALPAAMQNFMAFPRSVKRGILEWIHTARRPETRAARVAETARRAQSNQRANQWRGKDAA